MADITMCANQECKMREDCYRAMARIGIYQSWNKFSASSDNTCEHKIQIGADEAIKDEKK